MTEEQKLIHDAQKADAALKKIKADIAKQQILRNQFETDLDKAKEALLKYMDETGQVAFECGEMKVYYTESEQVDISDNAAVPDDYMRKKVSKEPNKVLIKELRPQANWYSIKSVRNLQIKMKG